MIRLPDTIGNTPLIELKKLSPSPKVRICAKMESANPGGSVKDRAAYWMIQRAIDRGDLRSGTKLIEATSGNTGIALAMMGALFGLDVELVMPEGATRERVLLMEAYGAKITQTPRDHFMEGAIDHVREKVETGGYFMLNQFANPDNVAAHYESTGPEIWRDSGGAVSHFVSAMGTTGTIMGVSRYLKERNPAVQIIGVQPEEGASIPGIKKWSDEYLPKIYDSSRIDKLFEVTYHDAVDMCRRLAREEGILAGISSGGAAHVAAQLAAGLDEGTIVFVVCDRGDRYLTAGVFG